MLKTQQNSLKNFLASPRGAPTKQLTKMVEGWRALRESWRGSGWRSSLLLTRYIMINPDLKPLFLFLRVNSVEWAFSVEWTWLRVKWALKVDLKINKNKLSLFSDNLIWKSTTTNQACFLIICPGWCDRHRQQAGLGLRWKAPRSHRGGEASQNSCFECKAQSAF